MTPPTTPAQGGETPSRLNAKRNEIHELINHLGDKVTQAKDSKEAAEIMVSRNRYISYMQGLTDGSNLEHLDALGTGRVPTPQAGETACCEYHDTNCTDIEEACCRRCPNWGGKPEFANPFRYETRESKHAARLVAELKDEELNAPTPHQEPDTSEHSLRYCSFFACHIGGSSKCPYVANPQYQPSATDPMSKLLDELEDAVWCSRGDNAAENSAARLRAVVAKTAIRKEVQRMKDEAVREALEDVRRRVIRRTKIPADARNPTRDLVVITGEVIAEEVIDPLLAALPTIDAGKGE